MKPSTEMKVVVSFWFSSLFWTGWVFVFQHEVAWTPQKGLWLIALWGLTWVVPLAAWYIADE